MCYIANQPKMFRTDNPPQNPPIIPSEFPSFLPQFTSSLLVPASQFTPTSPSPLPKHMDPTCKPYSHCHSVASPLRRCLLVSLLLLLLALLLVILGFTVLRPRHASTIVNSVRLSGLDASIESPSLSLSLNLTLTLDITANNPNHASFRYGQGSAQMYYQGNLVGLAVIPPGEVEAEGSVNCVVDLTVMAGRLASKYSAAYADVVAGSMDFTTETEIPGRVTVLGVFKHHMVSYTSCEVVIGVKSRTLESSDCRYRTKF